MPQVYLTIEELKHIKHALDWHDVYNDDDLELDETILLKVNESIERDRERERKRNDVP